MGTFSDVFQWGYFWLSYWKCILEKYSFVRITITSWNVCILERFSSRPGKEGCPNCWCVASIDYLQLPCPKTSWFFFNFFTLRFYFNLYIKKYISTSISLKLRNLFNRIQKLNHRDSRNFYHNRRLSHASRGVWDLTLEHEENWGPVAQRPKAIMSACVCI